MAHIIKRTKFGFNPDLPDTLDINWFLFPPPRDQMGAGGLGVSLPCRSRGGSLLVSRQPDQGRGPGLQQRGQLHVTSAQMTDPPDDVSRWRPVPQVNTHCLDLNTGGSDRGCCPVCTQCRDIIRGVEAVETPPSPADILEIVSRHNQTFYFIFFVWNFVVLFFWPISDVLFCTVLSLDSQLCCTLD